MGVVVVLVLLGVGLYLFVTGDIASSGTMDVNSDDQKPAPRIHQCIHCGQEFDLNESDGWRISQEQYTCNWCYMSGQRDNKTTYLDDE